MNSEIENKIDIRLRALDYLNANAVPRRKAKIKRVRADIKKLNDLVIKEEQTK